MNSRARDTPHAGEAPSFEPSDVNPFWLTASVLGLVALLAAICAGLWVLVGSWVRGPWPPQRAMPPSALARWADAPPQLQLVPPDDVQALRRREEARLSGWAWADREAGLARIPIANAMQLLAQAAAEDRLDELLPAPIPATRPEMRQTRSLP